MLKQKSNFSILEDDDNYYIDVEIAVAIIKDKKSGVKKQFEIQTLIFPKSKFKTAAEAKAWAKDKDFKSSKVDETGTSFRLRQKPPGKFKRLRTIDLGDGVKAVGGEMKKSKFMEMLKSIWALPDARFFAICDMFGTDNVFTELDQNPLWHGGHCFKSRHGGKRGKTTDESMKDQHGSKPNRGVKKFASNIDQKSAAETENKETWNGSRYENIPPGDREFVTEFGNKLEKAYIVYKDHVGIPAQGDKKYLDYMKKAANEILKNEDIRELAGMFATFDGQFIVNGHRHGQSNGGLTGTDIPVPGMPIFHFHFMEGGNGVTDAERSDGDHSHFEPRGGITGGNIFPSGSFLTSDSGIDMGVPEMDVPHLSKEFLEKRKINIMKLDAPRQIVIGALYVPFDENNPETVDTHGHACSKEEIQNAQIEFMRKMQLANVDLQHNFEKGYGFVVESYIAKDGDPDFIPGTWVVGVKVTDNNVWKQIVKGEIAGFSLAGSAFLREVA